MAGLLLLIMALIGGGCSATQDSSGNGQPGPPVQNHNGQKPEPLPTQPAPVPAGQSQESLGGLRLGMAAAEVDNLLGRQFEQRVEEEGGAFREAFTVRTYAKGIDVVIGSSSGKVLQIEAYSAEFPTKLGVRVGDKSIPALQNYRSQYQEFVGNQSPDILSGWFVVETGTLLIFSSMENRERSNRNLTPTSQIYSITLGYSRYFD